MAYYESQNECEKMAILAMMVALGVVLSPILRVPGMAPMQHFINVIVAVLLGPWYALACAILIALLRMWLMGVNLLAVTGAVFGAVLSGLLYRATGKCSPPWRVKSSGPASSARWPRIR